MKFNIDSKRINSIMSPESPRNGLPTRPVDPVAINPRRIPGRAVRPTFSWSPYGRILSEGPYWPAFRARCSMASTMGCILTVSAAIVTLIASGKVLPKYRWIASSVAAAGFLLFAAGNYKALDELRKQRNAVVEFVKDSAKNAPQIIAVAEASVPPTPTGLRIYHWGLCVFVVVLLIAIPAFQEGPKK